jgi:hypothetical protein
VLTERHNSIPEHQLPGFHQHPDVAPPPQFFGNYLLANDRLVAGSLAGPSAMAKEPLPLVELDVACGSSG